MDQKYFMRGGKIWASVNQNFCSVPRVRVPGGPGPLHTYLFTLFTTVTWHDRFQALKGNKIPTRWPRILRKRKWIRMIQRRRQRRLPLPLPLPLPPKKYKKISQNNLNTHHKCTNLKSYPGKKKKKKKVKRFKMFSPEQLVCSCDWLTLVMFWSILIIS